ncbi:VPLPA-CTERM sorting domain-containing protein [Nitrospira lenta]|uniref:Putative PEP motif anchor domain protein n=1 Tax=Nitrospira lenta TaxID=1436998 RepID=A0A330L8X1_9BACT|nr:VPLPA-CTERM sorting domain-containing protein [Nitrospira lenta]SPP63376.1 putative PEP motif anchor domain protein [Nitrospira lenta]
MKGIAQTMHRTVWSFLLCSLLALNAQAATVYDEALRGDLSNDHLHPTAVTLGVGQNLILGSTVHQPSLDRDFFTVTIGAGHALNAIVLSSYTTTDDQSFFGLARGSDFKTLGFSSLSGWALIGTLPGLSVGDNLLDFVADGPIGPGAYSFWLQETEGTTTYTLDYQVAPVPIPAALPLFLSGLLGIGAMARKVRYTMR